MKVLVYEILRAMSNTFILAVKKRSRQTANRMVCAANQRVSNERKKERAIRRERICQSKAPERKKTFARYEIICEDGQERKTGYSYKGELDPKCLEFGSA